MKNKLFVWCMLCMVMIGLTACGASAPPNTAIATQSPAPSATPTTAPSSSAAPTAKPTPSLMVSATVAPYPPPTTVVPATPLAVGQKVPVGNGAFTRIAPTELQKILANKNFFFVNTHIPYEGEIERTDAFIPFDTIAQNLNQLPADKNAPVVLYCRSGRMSTEAAETLVKLGYTNIWELGGGMIEWVNQGFKLIQK